MSFGVTCQLNSKFTESLKKKRFVSRDRTVKGFYGGYNVSKLIDVKKPRSDGPKFSLPGMACCGLEELDFYPLQEFWEQYKDDDVIFLDWVSAYIRYCVTEQDNRVLIVGIPIKVGENSQYNIEFYNKLRSSLKEIGFKEVNVPYKNQNSGNTIVALIGQLP